MEMKCDPISTIKRFFEHGQNWQTIKLVSGVSAVESRCEPNDCDEGSTGICLQHL